MTNEEKVRDLIAWKNYDNSYDDFDLLMELAKWKDQKLEDALSFIQLNNIMEPHMIVSCLRKLLLDK